MRRSRRSTGVARLCATLLALGLLVVTPAPGSAHAVGGARFVTTWESSEAALCLHGSVDVAIDWGDGHRRVVSGPRPADTTGPITHTFDGSADTHQVIVTGTFDRLGCDGPTPAGLTDLVSVDEWGPTGTTSVASAFAGATSLLSESVQPPLTVTDMSRMFYGAARFDGQLEGWDTSHVTDMSEMFAGTTFDGPLGSWDTSNVAVMRGMFADSEFNHPVGAWDTSSVTDMSDMFAVARAFDQPIGGWDTGDVTSMARMFQYGVFDQPVGDWDTSRVVSMNSMFFSTPFDQPIGGWETSRVVDMTQMFGSASAFNQDLSPWCVTLIRSEPFGFDDGAAAWTRRRPNWGSCSGGTDSTGPVVRFTSLTSTDMVRAKGSADDPSGVAKAFCAIQDRATGKWLRRDRTWGGYARLPADLSAPGAVTTRWFLARRLPPGSYTVKAIAFDGPGFVSPSPRPFRIVTVSP